MVLGQNQIIKFQSDLLASGLALAPLIFPKDFQNPHTLPLGNPQLQSPVLPQEQGQKEAVRGLDRRTRRADVHGDHCKIQLGN